MMKLENKEYSGLTNISPKIWYRTRYSMLADVPLKPGVVSITGIDNRRMIAYLHPEKEKRMDQIMERSLG